MAKSGSETNPMDCDDLVKEDDDGSSRDAPDEDELALRMANQCSRLDTGGSSSSIVSAASSSRSH